MTLPPPFPHPPYQSNTGCSSHEMPSQSTARLRDSLVGLSVAPTYICMLCIDVFRIQLFVLVEGTDPPPLVLSVWYLFTPGEIGIRTPWPWNLQEGGGAKAPPSCCQWHPGSRRYGFLGPWPNPVFFPWNAKSINCPVEGFTGRDFSRPNLHLYALHWRV